MHPGGLFVLLAPRGDVRQQVGERLVPAGDLHRGHADREARASLLLALLDELEEPGYGGGGGAQALGGAVPANHGIGLACSGERGSKVNRGFNEVNSETYSIMLSDSGG